MTYIKGKREENLCYAMYKIWGDHSCSLCQCCRLQHCCSVSDMPSIRRDGAARVSSPDSSSTPADPYSIILQSSFQWGLPSARPRIRTVARQLQGWSHSW